MSKVAHSQKIVCQFDINLILMECYVRWHYVGCTDAVILEHIVNVALFLFSMAFDIVKFVQAMSFLSNKLNMP